MIKGSGHSEDITILKVYALIIEVQTTQSRNWNEKCSNTKWQDNTPFSIIGIKTRQKISNDTEYLKNTISQFDLIDMDRAIQP